MTTKTLEFRYCNYLHYILANVVFIIVLFGMLCLCLYTLRRVVSPVVGLASLLSGLIFASFLSSCFAAKMTDKKGTAIFDDKEVRLVFAKKTVTMAYDKIISLAYKKIIGSSDGWSFLPASKLLIETDSECIRIHSSRKEAWEKKKECGILKPRKGAKPPDVSLWYVCDELNRRTGKQIYLEEVIERTD